MLAVPLAAAAPAQAALSGTGWTAQTLPANYLVGDGNDGPPLSPVSCVAGTQFCAAIVTDSANLLNGYIIGQAAVVTLDSGQDWTGYATLPASIEQFTGLSCPSATVCWASGTDWNGEPAVAQTTDGGQTWTDMTPTAWSTVTWSVNPNGIDCVSANTCWLAGQDWGPSGVSPAVVKTTDGGTTWTTFSNLPTFVSADPNGTYQLNGISCTSAQVCVAGGGLNEADGTATVISTTDGGATWTKSTDPTLSRLQQVFSVSCLPAPDGGPPVCRGAAVASAAAGPVAVISQDGGATWRAVRPFDTTGWLNSISCPDLRHCWAAGSGTTVALAGTRNGGGSWSLVTSDTTNEDGSVSCLSAQVCVATTDNALWVTSDGGGLGGAVDGQLTS